MRLGLRALHMEEHPYLEDSVTVGDAVTVSEEGRIELFSGQTPGHYCSGIVSKLISNTICEITCNGIVRNFGKDLRPGAKMYISDVDPGKLTEEESLSTPYGHLVGIALNSTDLMVITI